MAAIKHTGGPRADNATCLAPLCVAPIPAERRGRFDSCSRACSLRRVGLPAEFDPVQLGLRHGSGALPVLSAQAEAEIRRVLDDVTRVAFAYRAGGVR